MDIVIPSSQEPSKSEWSHLSISKSGSRILSVGGFPSYQLDVWDVCTSEAVPNVKPPTLGQQKPEGGSSESPAAATNVARVPLGDRLTGLGCYMFPSNNNVIAACGKQAIRLISLDPLPNHCTVRQVQHELTPICT